MTDAILQVHCQSLRCQLWQCKAFLTMLFLCPDLTNNNAKMVTSDEHFFGGGLLLKTNFDKKYSL